MHVSGETVLQLTAAARVVLSNWFISLCVQLLCLLASVQLAFCGEGGRAGQSDGPVLSRSEREFVN